MKEQKGSRKSCLTVLVIAAIVLWLISRGIAGSMIEANRLGCDMIQSVLNQVTPAERETLPQTAEQCRAAVDSTAWLFYGLTWFGTYVAAAVLSVFLGFILVLVAGLLGEKPKPKSEQLS